jgi:hypothetical protein
VKIEFSRPNLLVNGAPILVSWDDMPSGGARPWFECPVCSRRCRFLYLRERIACRQCEGLDWPSRHLHRSAPGVHRIARWRRQIGADLAPFSALPEPPPRRHVWFGRIAARIAIEEQALIRHLADINRDLDRRHRVRRERGWNRR